jgi:hypothetical protein
MKSRQLFDIVKLKMLSILVYKSSDHLGIKNKVFQTLVILKSQFKNEIIS